MLHLFGSQCWALAMVTQVLGGLPTRTLAAPTRGRLNFQQFRKQARPSAILGLDDVTQGTLQAYSKQVDQFLLFLEEHAGYPIGVFHKYGADRALVFWVLNYLQQGYDSGSLGLAQAGHLLSRPYRFGHFASWRHYDLHSTMIQSRRRRRPGQFSANVAAT